MEKIKFKYHPNIYEDDILVKEVGVCECCGETVSCYINQIYTEEDVERVCLACCDDYCQYLHRVGMDELEKMDCKNEILEEYALRDDAYSIDVVKQCMHKDGDMSGYLFQCCHCGKYHLWVDAN